MLSRHPALIPSQGGTRPSRVQRSRGRQLGLVGSKQDTLICCGALAGVRRALQQVFCGKFDCVYVSKGEREERGEKG